MKKFDIPRDELVIATKLFHERQKTPKAVHGSVNQRGLSRKHIFEAVKGSLERLETDYIDILYIHQVDENTPISETMDALNDVSSHLNSDLNANSDRSVY
jgi:aryl-alcohol dehydrogenase-like predicted oxidoreductase